MFCRRLACFIVTLGMPAHFLGLSGTWADEKAERLTQLTLQLGSSQYSEREAAERELDAAGPTALPALKRAAQSDDAEVRRRAEALVQQIEKRVETAKLLEPRTVRLVYRDKPVAEAVADFAHQTGFPLQIGGNTPQGNISVKPINRKITLDTGAVPFWEAFDRLCREAGLVEHHLVPKKQTAAAPVSREQQLAQVELQLARQQVVWTSTGRVATQPNQPTVLVEGPMPRLPTCQTGPVRFRALTPELYSSGFARSAEEVQFPLEVNTDPKLTWLHIGDLRVEKAVDEHGQTLTPLFTFPVSSQPVNQLEELFIVDGLNPYGNGLGPTFRTVPVRLKLGPKPSTVLRELTGTVAAQVQTPPEPLLTLDNLLRGNGRKVSGPDGSAMEVMDASLSPGGDLNLRVQVQTPLATNMGAQFVRAGRVVRVGAVRMMSSSAGVSGPTNPAVLDANGRSLPVTRLETRTTQTGDASILELTLTCRATKEQAEGAKLVYTGPRTHVIQVPFSLKDVPLP